MSNIATTIEQSKHLLELGLSKKTSDMSYSEEYFGRDKDGNDEWCWKLNACKFIDIEGIIPAWSLSALLEVMPNEYQPLLRKECKWYMDAWYEYGNLIAGGCYKPLDAAYEMVCKMLERGLLEKGGE